MVPALSRGGVDTAAHHRRDKEWLERAWRDPRTRVLVLRSGEGTSQTGYQALRAKQSRALVRFTEEDAELVFVASDASPDGERYFLGVDEVGHAYFAVRAPGHLPVDDGADAELRSLRDVGALLGARDSGLLTHAVSLANWHLTHRFCPTCGAPTKPRAGGHIRVCLQEGIEHFPRTDPAVIMLVHGDRDGEEKCLLAHNAQWPDGRRYSILAGFVEAGESLEQAVVREVAEEVGVAVTEPTYLGSQPWPFPRSLMLGYTARAVGDAPRTDHEEINQIRWFSRKELREATLSGEVLLPGSVSIARKLIEHWNGARLSGDW
ncbi:NAD(+) diphosphatase [Spiractinospora alimapuensis]|nr:NAD(+) diphosphatase [Spiractinospora alimapuensis]